MAADITEEFQVDLSKDATSISAENTGTNYDIAFGLEKFFDASSPDRPYRRQTAQYRKDQSDNSSEPGEQSLSGWWLRSQSSFHFGSGINFYEPTQDEKLRFRFADSEGVDVWTQGQVTLLKDVVASSHFITGSTPTMMRSIKWSNTNGVLVTDSYDVDKVAADGSVTHFIDYVSGTDTPVYAICDDGVTAYWLTNKVSGTKWTILSKPLTGDDTTAETTVYQVSTGAATSGVIEYAKQRLIVAVNNSIYSVTLSGTHALIYTEPSSTFKFTGITETNSNIYLSGYDGLRSVIYRITVTDGAATFLPDLSGAVVAAELPRGEIVHTIKSYIGYMLIGTSRGVRVAQVSDNGAIVYGPLLFESAQPVYQFAVSDRYAWCTAKINGDAGLIRIDLGQQLDSLLFAYANDLQVVDGGRTCSGVAFIGETNRLALTTPYTDSNGNIYIESATVLRPSGYVTTGKIRFNTSESKFFKYVKERAAYPGGSITLGTTTGNIVTVDAINGNNDIGILDTAALEFMQFIFTLNRDSTTTSAGPIMYGYQIKALPAARRQRLIQYNLFCFDHEKDRYNNSVGYTGRAYERLLSFEDLEASSDVVTVQDFRTGETFQGIIEECSFSGMKTPSKNFSGFGGVLTVTVRKI
jgi:hypothetical protein